jgi:hypothetical protein
MKLSKLHFGAALLCGTLVLTPLNATAEQLPSLEGTTYGLMLEELSEQVSRLQASDATDREHALYETASVLADQNMIMIRMIDALHDKVNGILENQDDLVRSGATKFEGIGLAVRGRR